MGTSEHQTDQQLIVAKFGGTSMSSAESIRRVSQIIQENEARRFIIVSAPGINEQYPIKVTDALLGGNWGYVAKRFFEIGDELEWRGAEWLNLVRESLDGNKDRNFCASRGEWLSAKMLADFIGAEFVDAKELIRINRGRRLDQEQSLRLIQARFEGSTSGRFVIPGYYGADSKGNIKTLSRGGSDITGSVIARGVGATVYENWTDVNGVMEQDPKINPEARHIPRLSIESMYQMARKGAQVLHEDSLRLLLGSQIPIHVRNTFNPASAGTWITAQAES